MQNNNNNNNNNNKNNNVIYFTSFGVEHIPKEMKAFINPSLSITTTFFRIQAYD